MRGIPAIFVVAILMAVFFMPVSIATAQAQQSTVTPRLDTPSGFPVPRFVSLKANQTHCRSGPSFDHPVRITYMRKGLPVMVVAETSDHWRKIRDSEGDECWSHRSKLSGIRTALVIVDGLALHTRPGPEMPMRARLGRGIIGRVEAVEGNWVQFSTDGMKGWASLSGFWGAQNAH